VWRGLNSYGAGWDGKACRRMPGCHSFRWISRMTMEEGLACWSLMRLAQSLQYLRVSLDWIALNRCIYLVLYTHCDCRTAPTILILSESNRPRLKQQSRSRNPKNRLTRAKLGNQKCLSHCTTTPRGIYRIYIPLDHTVGGSQSDRISPGPCRSTVPLYQVR